MIEFFSASVRVVNSERAIEECLETAFGEGQSTDCDLLLIHAAMGHQFQDLAKRARELAPNAKILGASCCGIVGSEGVSESMKDVAIMAMRGKGELFAVSLDGIFGHNSFEKAKQLAEELKAQSEDINMLYYLSSGIDVSNDRAIAGIESVFGGDITIFGATSSDNMRGITNYQLINDEVSNNGAFLIGFADPSLYAITQATHGFVATGLPFTVTKSEGNRIDELDGQPAWELYTKRLGLSSSATCADTIPIGALAEQLPPDVAKEYGNSHILRVVTKKGSNNEMYYTTACPVGTELWLTERNEELIFSELKKMIESILGQAVGQKPVAVFHADCLARGRYMLDRIRKEEIVEDMQGPLSSDDVVPPWLGMYGFGEFARLAGRNQYHNYTSGIYAIFRK